MGSEYIGTTLWPNPAALSFPASHVVLACAESCAFLGIFFYFIFPYHSPTTGTSSTDKSSDLFTLCK